MKKLFLFSLLLGVGCSSSSNSTNDPGSNATLIGAWAVKTVRLSNPAPSSNPMDCWKNLVATMGDVDITSGATALITLGMDGTFNGSIVPKIDTLPPSLNSCFPRNPYYGFTSAWLHSEQITGTYSAAAGQITITVTKNLVEGGEMGPGYSPTAAGTYSISGNTLNVNLTLFDKSVWKVTLTR